jgi:dolichyl-phosphate beta-glucosyltransferase
MATRGPDYEIIVVDNASSDGTSSVVRDVMRGCRSVTLLRTERRGKGLAVRQGVAVARGDIIIFADADMSWSLHDLVRIPRLVSEDTAIAIGYRGASDLHQEWEPLYRRVMSQLFNLVVRSCIVGGIHDSQCGFKVFRSDAAHRIFACMTIDGFGFDVEVLFLARHFGYSIVEVPLTWHHKPGSRVHALRDALKMLGDVVTVRRNALLGRYPSVMRLAS